MKTAIFAAIGIGISAVYLLILIPLAFWIDDRVDMDFEGTLERRIIYLGILIPMIAIIVFLLTEVT